MENGTPCSIGALIKEFRATVLRKLYRVRMYWIAITKRNC